MDSAREIVDSYYRFLKARDRDSLLEILSQDIVVTYHGQPGQLPWAGIFKGIDGFDQFFALIRDHLDIVEVSIVDAMESNNRFVNFCEGSWKYKDSGYIVQGSMVNVFTVTKGKITAYDVYADTAAFAAGLQA